MTQGKAYKNILVRLKSIKNRVNDYLVDLNENVLSIEEAEDVINGIGYDFEQIKKTLREYKITNPKKVSI